MRRMETSFLSLTFSMAALEASMASLKASKGFPAATCSAERQHLAHGRFQMPDVDLQRCIECNLRALVHRKDRLEGNIAALSIEKIAVDVSRALD
jgi:hypothetical protein